ncbi:MAG: hypothetical protein U5L04_10975 [Trueperaceae bacterium]|nr:hypothetical protein [Trueperaceae bacterium]
MSSVILISVVVTASLTALGSRVSAADERTSYQALLAAESGIDTLAARATAEKYRGPLNETALNGWLNTSGVGTIDFGNGNSAEVVADNVNGNDITFRSTSDVSGSRGTKVVLQEYQARREPPPPIGVPAALTSWPDVTVTGNAAVTGVDGETADGLIPDRTRTDLALPLTLNPSTGSTFSLNVDDTEELVAGEYVQIGGNTYRVEAVNGETSVTLTAVPALNQVRTITDNTAIDIVQYAATSGYDSSSPNTLRVTDTRNYLVGDTIHVGSFEAEITGVNSDGSLSVSWQGSQPNAVNGFGEGDAVRKDYDGVTSSGGIKDTGAREIENGTDPYSDRVKNPFGAENELFQQTFGMSYEAFEEIYPSSTSVPSSLSGVTHYRGDLSFQGNESICGSGILIVDGDLRINGTCDEGFSGVIYVKGEYSQQGNSAITGAVVAEGNTNLQTTRVAGTGGGQGGGGRGGGGGNEGDSKIEFDPVVLYEQGRLLSAWQFETIAGTWRQR